MRNIFNFEIPGYPLLAGLKDLRRDQKSGGRGGDKLRCQKIITAKEDELPFKGINMGGGGKPSSEALDEMDKCVIHTKVETLGS